MATKLNVAYIKTNDANTYDLLRVDATGNLEYASVNNLNLTTANVNELGSNLYYSNARVYANVAAMLPTYTGNVNAGNITANSIVSSGTGPATLSSTADINLSSSGNINISAANIRLGNIIVDNIRANSWSGLIAGNNIIIAANGQISANLLAASVNVNSVSGNLAVSGNVIANGAVIANSIISTGSGSASLSSSADINLSATGNINLIAANVYTSNLTVNRVTSNIWSGLYAANVIGLTTANVTELTNLYYTNARVYSNISPLLFNYQTLANAALKANIADLTTANVLELTNLYYTNARVYSNVIALLQTLAGNNIIIAANGQISANLLAAGGGAASSVLANGVIGLNTANVNEFGSNLYYTNARVYSNVIALLPTYTGNLAAGNLAISGGVGGSLTGANLISANNLSATNWLGLYAANVIGLNTANVSELTNLYYTNARVYSNVITLLQTLAGNNIIIAANGQISANLLAAGGGAASSVLANGVIGLNTANVNEFGSNLYYSNARVYSNVIALLPTYTGNLAAGNLAISGGVGGSLTGANLISANNLSATNWLGLYAANVIGLNTANVAELTNLYYTNARVYSNISPLLGAKANVSDLTSANIIELTNLYFTNARVLAGLVTQDLIVNNATIRGDLIVEGNTVTLNTATLVVEDRNIMLANGATNSATADGAGINITGAQANLIYRSTGDKFEFNKSLDVLGTLTANSWGNLYAANVIGLNTANVNEFGSNLYYSNARVYSNVIATLPTYTGNINAGNIIANTFIGGGGGGFITGANLISTNIISATTWTGLYAANVLGLNTANVAELTNLYYTNARVYSNVIALLPTLAGSGISIAANGQITSTATSSSYGNANVAAFITTYTGNINAGNITANSIISSGASTGAISATADIILTAGGNINLVAANVYTSNITVNRITANAWVGITASNVVGLTTANVSELTNLYYTNARTYSNTIQLLPTLAGSGIAIAANGQISSTASGTYGNANVAAFITTYTGNINAGNITANSIISAGASTGAISATADIILTAGGNINLVASNVYTSNITVNRITSNIWTGLYAANVLGLNTANVAELTNLYYTNTRVFSNVIALLQTLAGNNIIIAANGQISANLLAAGGGAASSVLANGVIGLNTANVNEFGSNLYYTNARVYSNVATMLPYYTGNISAGNVLANTIISTGGSSGTISATNDFNIAAGSNINLIAPATNANNLTVNNLTSNSWTGLYASNVVGLTTANVVELTNLYYTNARVLAGLVTQDLIVNNATIRGDLIVEGNTVTLNTATLIVEDKNIMLANGAVNAAAADGAGLNIIGAQANLTYRNTGDKFEFNKSLDVLGTVTANSWGNLYAANIIGLTTANVAELTNLYYTNARVYSNVITLLPTLAGSGISIAANGQISSTAAGSYGNANVAAYLITNTGNVNAGNIIANTFISTGAGSGTISSSADFGITATGNINLSAEAVRSSNIFVDKITANIWSGLIAGNNIIIAANGQISANLLGIAASSSYSDANVASYLATNTGNIRAGNIIANTFISTGAGSGTISSSADFGITATGNINLSAANVFTSNITVNNITSNIWSGLYAANVIGLTTANVAELTNLYYTNARVYSNVIGLINVKANVSDLTTANVIELTNLYYTNARVYSNVIGLLNTKANVVDLTTANVVELTNLYYTNARVSSNVIELLPTLAGAGIAIAANGQISSTAASSSYGNANVAAFITTYTGNISAGNIIANAIVSGGTGGGGSITGANLISANNIIANTIISGYGGGGSITGANLISANNIIANSIISGSSGGGAITGANLIQSNNISSLNWIGLYTSNIIQSSGNLFLSNATLRDTILNLTDGSLAVDANGRIGVNFYANSQIITASSSFVNYNLNYSNTTNSSIFVAIEGIIQIPGVDYYVNGQTLTLTSAPDTGANIEVRYMGLKQSQGPQTPSTSMDTISAFLLMGA